MIDDLPSQQRLTETGALPVPIQDPAAVVNASPLGVITRDPPPDVAGGPGAPIIKIDPATGGPAPEAPPAAMNPAVFAPPMPAGANIGALDKQGNRIAGVGEAQAAVAGRTADEIRKANEARGEAIDTQVGAQKTAAEAKASGLDAQLAEHISYQQRLEDIKKREVEAMKEYRLEHEEKVQDAIYGNMSREQRKADQALANNAAASPTQRAAAQSRLDKAKDIDPNQLFAGDGGTAREITAALAMAFGAIGAARTGGPNYAMQIINKAIDDNIAKQRHAFDKRKREADEAGDRVASVRGEFDSERQDALAQKAIALEATKLKIDKILAGNEGTEAWAKGQEMKAQLDAQTAALAGEAEQKGLNDAREALVQQAGVMTNAAQLREQRAAGAASAMASAKDGSVPGLEGRATSSTAHNEATSMWGDGQGMLAQIKNLREFVQGKEGTNSKGEKKTDGSGTGREVFGTNKAKEAQAMADTLRLDFGKNLLKLGVLSDSDMDMLNNIIPKDPTEFNQGSVAAKLKNAETFVRTKMNYYLKARGLGIPKEQQQ